MAANAAAHQDSPEERHGQRGLEVDHPAQKDVEQPEQPFALIRPTPVVDEFQAKETETGAEGEVMPENQLAKGNLENASAEKNRGRPDVAGACEDTEPPHRARGLLDFAARGVWVVLHLVLRQILITSCCHGVGQLTAIITAGTLEEKIIRSALLLCRGFFSTEVCAMTQFSEYFCRNLGALTSEQQQTLQKRRVAVIGCGGLGGYVIEQLVRIGVGHLHLFDPDVFAPSNCNRQLNALSPTLGRNKAEVAAARSATIHPFSTVIPFPLNFQTAPEEAWDRVDAVVDCLDNVQARHDLAALCTARKIPLVHGAVNGWYGQVGVQLAGGDLIARLYPMRAANPSAEPPSVLSFAVAVIASLQAGETVKLLLDLPSPLHNHWMHIDLKDCDLSMQV